MLGLRRNEGTCSGHSECETNQDMHFAMEDRLEAKSNTHAAELPERAKARLERIVTDPNQAKAAATAIEDKRELIKKLATAPPAP